MIGSLGRVWEALGGSPSASILQAPTSAVYDASFSVASPIESGTNSSAATGDVLPLGGYLNAFLTAGEEDWYSVTVPDGTYTFATAGQVGACGLGIQANTKLELFTDTGTPVASNDDGSGYDYCGQVTQTLSAEPMTFESRARLQSPSGEPNKNPASTESSCSSRSSWGAASLARRLSFPSSSVPS